MTLSPAERIWRRHFQQGKFADLDQIVSVIDHIYSNVEIDIAERFHNFFFYEACPLVSIAEKLNGSIDGIAFTGQKERYDGLFLIGGKSQKIECVAAIDGQNEALIMEHLQLYGRAPANLKIHATGTKNHRKIDEHNAIARDREADLESELLPLLAQALRSKIEKSKTNPNYCEAWLSIVFDDWLVPAAEQKKQSFDPLCKKVLKLDPTGNRPFERVFFVGMSRQYIFDSFDI